MQENKDYVAKPSQISASDREDSPSVLLHSSKLRNKLEKLAHWRIDPSSIEFTANAREFRGGFATVSQGLLASPSRAGRGAKMSGHVRDEHPSPDAGDPKADSEAQEPRDDDQGKGQGADGCGGEGDDNHPKGEEIGDPLASSEQTVDEDSVLGHHNPQSDIHLPDGDRQGNDKGPGSRIANGDNDPTQEEGRNKSDNSKEERNSDHQTSKPKIVAVKKLKIESGTDIERVLGLALRESEFLVELSHPNIVKLEGFVEDLSAQKVWLIFPWEEHGNLRDFLASGEWEVPERISLINDVTLGLEYLHSRDPPVYHGDLKSLNILVSSECYALITDFGSARRLDGDVGKHPKEEDDKPLPATDSTTGAQDITLEALFSATASTLTLTGSSYTLRWAAPELLQDDRPCLRSDIWALGWIAYEVMTNTIPFHDIKKDAIVINRVIQGQLPSVTQDARMSLIRALCSLMVQCWSMNPDKRPTAEECRKSISWMPMIVPAHTQGMNEEVSSTRGAQLLNRLGEMYKQQGDYLNAFDCFTKASNIYTTNNDSNGKAYNLHSLADLHLFRGEHVEAASFYTEALQIYTETGDRTERASSIRGLAEVRRLQGEYNEASRLYSECLQIYTDIGTRRHRAVTLSGLASVHLHHDEYSQAETLYSEALEIFTEVGDRQGQGTALWNLAEVYRLQKEYSQATKRYSEALETYIDIGDKQGRGTVLWGFAQVHRNRGEYNEAIKLFSEATEIFTDVGDKYWRAEALMCLALSHLAQAHYSEAISFYTEASEVLEDIGEPQRAADVLKNAADIRKTAEEVAAGSVETAKVEEDPLLNLN
ncbi:hypothetical protein M407DRAFT_29893 [Tulasnella calospora MUT 4182]|uniref:Protein kinase domain-containing protein n=1 Tax=Tulasnella calospora MUT 4182 TaxID=1051891 RepID=A0A0C3PYQ4_9AGAM|nr:hypothetical protein M407DRAFT_29893 [Tulasnella calospora MUT 4182]